MLISNEVFPEKGLRICTWLCRFYKQLSYRRPTKQECPPPTPSTFLFSPQAPVKPGAGGLEPVCRAANVLVPGSARGPA